MNSLANQYNQILSTLTHCPESERLEPLLANFASQVATEGCTLVYIQTSPSLVISASSGLLELYGIQLARQCLNQKAFIYANLKPSDPDIYAGAVVLEHKAEQDWQVAA